MPALIAKGPGLSGKEVKTVEKENLKQDQRVNQVLARPAENPY